MLRSNRWTLILALVGALFTAIPALGGCGSSDSGRDGEGGGGGGGELPCGGRICPPGRSCNEQNGRCECTTEPDSCAAIDTVMACSPTAKVCVRQTVPLEEKELGPCTKPGRRSQDGALLCLGLGLGKFGALPCKSEEEFCLWSDYAAVWVRPCQSTSECPIPPSVCLTASTQGEKPYCWINYCGDDRVEVDAHGAPILDADGKPTYLNGESGAACDTSLGVLTDPATATGTCSPLTVGPCIPQHTEELTGSCLPPTIPEAERRTAFLCREGGRPAP